MKIKLIEVAGFVAVFEALRLPFKLPARSTLSFDLDSEHEEECIIKTESYVNIHHKDLALLNALIKKGDDEAKVMRGIEAYLSISMPLYLMIELDTYRVGTDTLATSSTMHVDCKGLTGEELQEVKGEIPGKYIYDRVEKFSYQALRRIYFARRNHRLPEWIQICKFIEGLPMSELITGKDK